MMKPRTTYLIYVLFTLSGIAGLIYESIWSRYLKLLLGHSSYGQILTLMIFMGGLGIGSFWGGKWASQLKKPLLLYAAAEGLVGLGALLYHNLFLSTQQALFQVLASLKLTGLPAMALKSVASLLITMPWAIALGITFPALAIGLMTLSQDSGRHTLPWLYFSNSLGGAVGILSASYLLIPALGTPGTLILAGFINIALAAGFYLLAQSLHPAEKPAEATSHTLPPLSNSAFIRLLLGVSLLTGLSSFLYEIAWIRLLSLIIGSSTHSFDVMVAAFISGLALGGLFARRLHQKLQHPILVLAAVHLLMGVAAALSLILYESLFALVQSSHLVFQPSDEAFPWYSLFKYRLCLMLMLPASFFAGTTLPLITWTLVRSQGDSSHVGSVYGWNTIGAILGASLGGLVILPVLQLKWTLLSGALVDVGLGLVLLAVIRPGKVKWMLAAVISFGLMLPGMSLQLNAFTLSSGRYRRYENDVSLPDVDQIKIRDGRTATISFQNHAGRLTIKTNGKPDASLDLSPIPGQNSDEITQMALAMYPVNLMKKPYRAAMIGMGSGMTAHTLLGDPQLQNLDLIEIEPVVTELAKGFEPFNKRVYTSPKSHLIFDDAKSYFFAQQQQYDLIVSEPSNPWVSGVASLFSAEFYDYIRKFMTPDAVLVQWMHTYEFDDLLFLSILKALHDHFHEIAIYGIPTAKAGRLAYNDVVIVASQQAIQLNSQALPAGVWLEDFARLHRSPDEYIQSNQLVRSKTLEPLLRQVNANSDFFPIVDDGAEKAFYTKKHVQLFDFLYETPVYYQSLFEPDFSKNLQQRLQLRIDQGELSQALGQLGQLLSAPAHLSETDRILDTFHALVNSFFPVLSLKEHSIEVFKAYLIQNDLKDELLQFDFLEALKNHQFEKANQAIDQILEKIPSPGVQLPVIRAMAVYCLQQADSKRLDLVIRYLALPHPKISEVEKLYLGALSEQNEAVKSR